MNNVMEIKINDKDKTIVIYSGKLGEIINFLKDSLKDWGEYTIINEIATIVNIPYQPSPTVSYPASPIELPFVKYSTDTISTTFDLNTIKF